MLKSYGVSKRSKRSMNDAIKPNITPVQDMARPKGPSGSLIDSANQKRANQQQANGQQNHEQPMQQPQSLMQQAQQQGMAAPAPMGHAASQQTPKGGDGGMMQGVLGSMAAPMANNASQTIGVGRQALQFVSDHPVAAHAIATAVTVVAPPAGAAMHAGIRAAHAVNTVDDMTGGHIKGDGKAPQAGGGVMSMVQGQSNQNPEQQAPQQEGSQTFNEDGLSFNGLISDIKTLLKSDKSMSQVNEGYAKAEGKADERARNAANELATEATIQGITMAM